MSLGLWMKTVSLMTWMAISTTSLLSMILSGIQNLPGVKPWTIVLSGVLAIACSWLIFHTLLSTTLVSLLVCIWWYIFLYSYPQAYLDMITERRNRLTNGVEDTFGLDKSQ